MKTKQKITVRKCSEYNLKESKVKGDLVIFDYQEQMPPPVTKVKEYLNNANMKYKILSLEPTIVVSLDS